MINRINFPDSSESCSLSRHDSLAFSAIVNVASALFEASKDSRQCHSPPHKRRKIERLPSWSESNPILAKLEKIPSKQIITYEEGSIYKRYEGFLKDDLPDGEGKMTFSNEAVFQGIFEDRGQKASGTLTKNNGVVTKGVWINWHLRGQATIFYPDGYRIKGCFTEGVPFVGEVTYLQRFSRGLYGKQMKAKQSLEEVTWPSSAIFENSSDRGLTGCSIKPFKISAIIKEQISAEKQPDGEMIAVASLGCKLERYLTEKLSFEGTIIYPDGSLYKRYEGCLKGAIPFGWGEMLYANGDIDSGQFANGVLRTGKRTLETEEWYRGEWVDGKLHGEGKCFLSNSQLLEGIFKEGELSEGRITYLRNDDSVCKVYEGAIKEKLPHGWGEIDYQNGVRYKGMFKKGVFHGFGELTQADGSSIKGEFANGELAKRFKGAHFEARKSILSSCTTNLF